MLCLVQYWDLPNIALSQKKTKVLAVANWTALSVSRVASLHMGCRQSIVAIPVISVWSVINFWVTWKSERFLGLIRGRSQILCVVYTKMNCSLKSDRQIYTSYGCVQIEMLHLIHGTETISLSQNREDHLHVRHVVCWYLETVWPNFCRCLRFLSFLKRRVSLYFLNLQENFQCSWSSSAVTSFLVPASRTASFGHPWEPSRLYFVLVVSLYLTNSFRQGALSIPGLFDATGFCSSRTNLSRHWKPDSSSSALTLPRSCLLRPVLASFSPSFIVQLVKLNFWKQQNKLKWLMLNRWGRLFHSSRVKFPLVNMSASWCLVSTYLIWILGSRLIILSNNQSRATLWVLDTCLIVGLLPLIII